MQQVPVINVPTVSPYRLVVERNDQGTATMTFYHNGVEQFSASRGGWDDAIPWASGNYFAEQSTRFNLPMWDFINDPAGREAVQLHVAQGANSTNPISAGSFGCLLADGAFLTSMSNFIAAHGRAPLQIDVRNDYSCSLSVSSAITQTDEGSRCTLTINLNGDSTGVSKDLYVKVGLAPGSTANYGDIRFISDPVPGTSTDDLRSLISIPNAASPSLRFESGLYVRIPAGQTTGQLVFDVLQDNIQEPSEVLIFRVEDYAFNSPYTNGRERLYSDYLTNPGVLIEQSGTASITIGEASTLDEVAIRASGANFTFFEIGRVTPGNSYSYSFDAYSIPDSVTIYDNTQTYVNTGLASGLSSGTIVIPVNSDGYLRVRVEGNPDPGTVWDLFVGGAGAAITAQDSIVRIQAVGQSTAIQKEQWEFNTPHLRFRPPVASSEVVYSAVEVVSNTDGQLVLPAGGPATVTASLIAGRTYSVVVIVPSGEELTLQGTVTGSVAGEAFDLDRTFSNENLVGYIQADRNETITITLREIDGDPGTVRVVFREVQPADLNAFTVGMANRIVQESDQIDADGVAFTVYRTGDNDTTATVSWRLVPDGTTPVSAADFGGVLPSGTITFEPGRVQNFIQVFPTVDGGSELVEGFRIELFNPSGAQLATVETHGQSATVSGVIVDQFDGPVVDNGSMFEDEILGGPAADRLSGGAGNDSIIAGPGNDSLNGGTGSDIMNGGSGNDVYYVDNSGDQLVESETAGGIDTVISSVTRVLGVNFEHLTLNGTAAINAFGNSQNNVLTGNSAGNIMSGGLGADTMSGGLGNDIYYVENAGDRAIETSASGGVDRVMSSVSFVLGSNMEQLTLTGTAAIDGNGNALNNILTGNDGSNALNGGAGVDTLSGGSGNDVYYLENVNDRAIESSAAGGIDTVISSVSFVLGSYVENLTLIGAALTATGNTLNNSLVGNAGANTLNGGDGNDALNGGAGADTMYGGNGNDTYYVDNGGDRSTESSATGGTDRVVSSITSVIGPNIENLTLTGSNATNGTGNNLNNVIIGNTAANTLSGGAGIDTMYGGNGNDTYHVDNSADQAIETSAAGGSDAVSSSVTFVLGNNLENLYLTGTAAINGTGNSLNNILVGNAGANTLNAGNGNDTLSGGGGVDTMYGGNGNDSYYVDNGSDQAIETSATGGTDSVSSSTTFVLRNYVENLYLTGSAAINGTGNTLNNALVGNAGANTLNGGDGNDSLNGSAGADSMYGGNGTDTYFVDNAGDRVYEGAVVGVDHVNSSVTFVLGANVEDLTLIGSSAANGFGNAQANTIIGNGANNIVSGHTGNDTIDGAAGTDHLYGGAGNDRLTGGAGADRFFFNTALNPSSNVDTIVDFSVIDDAISLDQSVFSALPSSGTLALAAFRTGTAATDADDRIIYDAATGRIYYDADGNGAGAQVLFAQVTAGLALTNADFLLLP